MSGLPRKSGVPPRLGLLGRLLAGGTFAYAGFVKAAAPAAEFAYAIESYRVLPVSFTLAAAYILPWTELLLGLLLLAGLFTRISAFLAGGLLVVFEGFLLSVMVRKIPVASCGCFGSSAASSPPREFLLNLALLTGAALAWKYGARLFSVDGYEEGPGHKGPR